MDNFRIEKITNTQILLEEKKQIIKKIIKKYKLLKERISFIFHYIRNISKNKFNVKGNKFYSNKNLI